MRENIQKKMNVRTELARLQTMELDELKNYWREVYGKEAPDCGKVFLRKQLSFRVQELQYGGISETAQAVLVEAGNLPKLKPNSGGVLPGTRFERGRSCKVSVWLCRSISAIPAQQPKLPSIWKGACASYRL